MGCGAAFLFCIVHLLAIPYHPAHSSLALCICLQSRI
jgi:hypothetical protein